jgi:hypothetical protein
MAAQRHHAVVDQGDHQALLPGWSGVSDSARLANPG